MRELIRNSVGPTVEIEWQLGDDLGTVTSDPTQLELAVLNLAINARDAMPSGGKLTIGADRRGEQVAITVSDTGIGMPPELQERVLEPFFTTKGPGKGTGLGLSMAYGVAQQAGGDLTIDSQVGKGTVITMLFPRKDAEPEVTAVAGPEAGTAEASSTGANILLVDDDMDVRLAVADMLAARGHTVYQAEDGQQALAKVEHRPIDLALLDYAMPGMNGAEVAKAALQIRPGLKLLFLSGFADSEAIDRAVHGRARVLKKPIGAADLAAAIDEMLKG